MNSGQLAHIPRIIVYVLQGDKKRYIGITNNLLRRLEEHTSTNSTVSRLIGEFKLLHTEEYPDYASARQREKFLKSGQGKEFLNDLYPGKGSACGG